jgi:hypothetical protein
MALRNTWAINGTAILLSNRNLTHRLVKTENTQDRAMNVTTLATIIGK